MAKDAIQVIDSVDTAADGRDVAEDRYEEESKEESQPQKICRLVNELQSAFRNRTRRQQEDIQEFEVQKQSVNDFMQKLPRKVNKQGCEKQIEDINGLI
jgi:hypothetical protein